MHHFNVTRFVFFSCLLVPFSANAHHSRANYDMTKEVVYDGTVSEVEWKNPHIFITVETKDAAGKSEKHEIEVASISESIALGLRKEAIAPGTKVSVRAHPGRRGADSKAVGLDIRTSDGNVYPLNTDANFAVRAADVKADSIAGHWAPTVESFNGTFPASVSWPVTPAGEAARANAAQKFTTQSLAALGICQQFPPPLLGIFPDVRVIEVAPATVTLRFEGGVGLLMERVVHLDQTTHPADLKSSTMGHSIGHWEGQNLIVDTVGITPHDIGLLAMPSSAVMHLTERLALSDDHLHLNYTFTIDDAEYLQQPVSYTATWIHRPDLELATSNTCDADNARRALEE